MALTLTGQILFSTLKKLGCFYVTAILSSGWVEVEIEVELELRLIWVGVWSEIGVRLSLGWGWDCGWDDIQLRLVWVELRWN